MAKRRRKKRKLKKGWGRFFIILFFLIALFIASRTLPIFNINNIKVSGISKLKSETVISKSNLETGVNIFKADLKKASKRINELPYVKSSKVKMLFPAGVEIIVTEEKVACYIAHGKKFVAINSDGKVLETATKQSDKVMLFTKLKIASDKAGEKINFENVNYFDILKKVMWAIYENQLDAKTKTVDISNSSNIKIGLDNSLEIIIGTTSELDYKLKLTNTILAEGYEKGIFNVSNPQQPTYRKN